jgi:hypothetical protein
VEKLLIGRSGVLLQQSVLGKFDRSTSGKIRSIDSLGLPNFQAFLHEICHSSLIDLQTTKTQKLTKTSENNKAKGLTNANQGVQIHNIWHSSKLTHPDHEDRCSDI